MGLQQGGTSAQLRSRRSLAVCCALLFAGWPVLSGAAPAAGQAQLAGPVPKPASAPAPALAPAARRLVLSTILDAERSYGGRLLALIYTEAFRQLNVELEIRSYPATRGSVEAAAGNVDGELARGYDYQSFQPLLMRVPEATLSIVTSAYARGPAIRIAGLDDLRGSRYRVEYRAGLVLIRQALEARVPAAQLSSVADTEPGLKKLAMGRSDLYVDIDIAVQPLLSEPALRDSDIRVAGVLDRSAVYAYLHRRHADLVPQLSSVLRKMKAAGIIDRYRVVAAAPTRSPPPSSPPLAGAR